MASGSMLVVLASLLTTFLAYAYRIHVQDDMLLRAFGEPYVEYRRDVPALIPFLH